VSRSVIVVLEMRSVPSCIFAEKPKLPCRSTVEASTSVTLIAVEAAAYTLNLASTVPAGRRRPAT